MQLALLLLLLSLRIASAHQHPSPSSTRALLDHAWTNPVPLGRALLARSPPVENCTKVKSSLERRNRQTNCQYESRLDRSSSLDPDLNLEFGFGLKKEVRSLIKIKLLDVASQTSWLNQTRRQEDCF